MNFVLDNSVTMRWFFGDGQKGEDMVIDSFAELEDRYLDPSVTSKKKKPTAALRAQPSLKDFVSGGSERAEGI